MARPDMCRAERAGLGFRPIAEEDLDFLRALYASTREDELNQVQWEPGQRETFEAMQFEAQHRHYQEHFPAARFELVLEGEEPIGRLYVDRRDDEIRLIDIALTAERRGGGLGSALLRDLLDEGEARDLPVRIHVERFNPAMRLYERLGFQAVEDQGVYHLMEWRPGAGGGPEDGGEG